MWLYLAIAAYFLNAAAFVIDKFLLASSIPRPFAYAFWVGILSSAVFILLPLGIAWHGIYFFFISFISGASFLLGLVFLYRAIKKTEVSIASTKVGALSVIFTYIFSVLILKDTLSVERLTAFLLMVSGIFLLGRTSKKTWLYSSIAGASLGISLVLLKWAFNNSNFLDGFFWTRIGFIGASLSVLVLPSARKEIFLAVKASSGFSKILFVFNKLVAGTGFFLLYLAIRFGDVAIVNSLLGIQFIFIFLIAGLLGKKVPDISEPMNVRMVLRKLAGILIIVSGLLILFT